MGSGHGWWEDVIDPGVRGIDQLNQGMGRAMVRAFTAQLLADPAVSLVQTDPSPDNARAIRCYVRASSRCERSSRRMAQRCSCIAYGPAWTAEREGHCGDRAVPVDR